MIKVSVIESQRKVVARLDGCSMDAYNILTKHLPPYMDICPCAVAIKNSFKATAKCHPDDDFDPEFGAQLARERVINKYNAAVAKVLNRVANDIDEYLSGVDEKLDHFEG